MKTVLYVIILWVFYQVGYVNANQQTDKNCESFGKSYTDKYNLICSSRTSHTERHIEHSQPMKEI